MLEDMGDGTVALRHPDTVHVNESAMIKTQTLLVANVHVANLVP